MTRKNADVSGLDLIGLMGSYEMECGVARLLNLARERGLAFGSMQLQPKDFSNDGYERDGFYQLLHYGWLRREGNHCVAAPQLMQRAEKAKRKIAEGA
jgi:hypothetical protein